MRTPLLLTATLILAVGFIYYAGNFTPTDTPRPLTKPTVQPTTAAPAPGAPLTPDQARQITSQQRLELIKKGVLIRDHDLQAAVLCPLIATLTIEDLSEADGIIMAKHWEENKSEEQYYSQEVWDTLWFQRGRVDPLNNISMIGGKHLLGPAGNGDYKLLEGWFATDPAAALAWAQSPKENENPNSLTACAYVLTLSAAGDPQKLVATLLALPPGDSKLKYCLPAYFDIIATTTGNPDPATIYDNIPAPLREAALDVTLGRLMDADPQAAADWLTAHVNEPGREYSGIRYLTLMLSEKDPAGTAHWAASLPDDTTDTAWQPHAAYATQIWYEKDPVAAKAWLQTQPSTLHWVEESFKAIEEMDSPKKPEADRTEN